VASKGSSPIDDRGPTLHAGHLRRAATLFGCNRGADFSAGHIRQIRFVGLLLGPRLDCRHHNDWSLNPPFSCPWRVEGVLHRLVKGLKSSVTQSDGIALSFPGKLDNPFGYPRHRRIIAIYQAQVTQSIFQCNCERRERVRREDFLLAFQGGPNGHFRYTRRDAHLPVGS
jgi:hypothetical protein